MGRLYEVLSFNYRLRSDWPHAVKGKGLEMQPWDKPGWQWRRLQTQIVAIVKSCRRLPKEEQLAFDQQRAKIAQGRRHMLPCLASLRPDLAPMGGAEWDAARLSFLSQLGTNSPHLLLALSSESTTPSYDVVYLRSITEQIDRPVRLVGILERAGLDTLRKTGHRQRPVFLTLCDQASRCDVSLHDLVLAHSHSDRHVPPRRSSSLGAIRVVDSRRTQPSCRATLASDSVSQTRFSLPTL